MYSVSVTQGEAPHSPINLHFEPVKKLITRKQAIIWQATPQPISQQHHSSMVRRPRPLLPHSRWCPCCAASPASAATCSCLSRAPHGVPALVLRVVPPPTERGRVCDVLAAVCPPVLNGVGCMWTRGPTRGACPPPLERQCECGLPRVQFLRACVGRGGGAC